MNENGSISSGKSVEKKGRPEPITLPPPARTPGRTPRGSVSAASVTTQQNMTRRHVMLRLALAGDCDSEGISRKGLSYLPGVVGHPR